MPFKKFGSIYLSFYINLIKYSILNMEYHIFIWQIIYRDIVFLVNIQFILRVSTKSSRIYTFFFFCYGDFYYFGPIKLFMCVDNTCASVSTLTVLTSCHNLGYIGDDEANAAAFDSDGWLKTGDLCYIDHDGFIYVIDRFKELIKYKAYQVRELLVCLCG